MVSPVILHGLQAVAPLKRGRTRAKESKPVKPVDEQHVCSVLAHTTPVVAAMIELQLLTGMRPGELVTMRPCDRADTNATEQANRGVTLWQHWHELA